MAIDFFGATGRLSAESLVAGLEARIAEGKQMAKEQPQAASRVTTDLKGRIWVTRTGVHVDRIACSWLIRRFIDPDAVIRIVPETNRANDNAPSHRVYVGRSEIGAAWSKCANEGRDYLSVKLDDPSFNAPIYANLFDDEDGDGYTLIWSRARRQNGD